MSTTDPALPIALFVVGGAIFGPLLHRDMTRADAKRRHREWRKANPAAARLLDLAPRISAALQAAGLSMEKAGRTLSEFGRAASRR